MKLIKVDRIKSGYSIWFWRTKHLSGFYYKRLVSFGYVRSQWIEAGNKPRITYNSNGATKGKDKCLIALLYSGISCLDIQI